MIKEIACGLGGAALALYLADRACNGNLEKYIEINKLLNNAGDKVDPASPERVKYAVEAANAVAEMATETIQSHGFSMREMPEALEQGIEDTNKVFAAYMAEIIEPQNYTEEDREEHRRIREQMELRSLMAYRNR